MGITKERAKYHEMLEVFKSCLSPCALVYDIGKSTRWDYRENFKGFNYKTIDRKKEVEPDIWLNFEEEVNIEKADGILCNGVIEQCDNIFKIIGNIEKTLKPKGLLLFGGVSVGFPIYGMDYLRVTPKGARKLLKNFNISTESIVYRNDLSSYIYLMGKK